MASKSSILCLGDSHTFGMAGGAWVKTLAATFPRCTFTNTGVNGHQTINVHRKLDKSLGAMGKASVPAAVTLLIGTNDVLLTLLEERKDIGARFYRTANSYSGPAGLDSYKQHLTALLAALHTKLSARLQKHQEQSQQSSGPNTSILDSPSSSSPSSPQSTPAPRTPTPTPTQSTTNTAVVIPLLVLTLPPLGEDLADSANAKVDEFNDALTEVVTDFAREQEQQQQEQQQQDLQQQQHEGGANGGNSGVSSSGGSSGSSCRCYLDVKLLDLSSVCKAAIRKLQQEQQQQQLLPTLPPQQQQQQRRRKPPVGLGWSFLVTGANMAAAMLRRYLLGVSFDRQSDDAGAAVLTPDGIHLNDRGGELVRGLVEAELRKLRQQAAAV